MSTKTARQIFTTHVAPVLAATAAFALVLVYGPAVAHFGAVLLQGTWDAIVSLFTIGQHARPASGLACWSEIKVNLPTETICGDVAHAPASAVDFTSYPTPLPF